MLPDREGDLCGLAMMLGNVMIPQRVVKVRLYLGERSTDLIDHLITITNHTTGVYP